ncbi:hypothetical protein TCAL_02038 [Tigriopus californicus]|uniref:Nitrilase and fragile histidine triad fusion protein NitFhit n=2 Tax=Tigriopus californicus TaxID=6832 RepID=A0A553NEH6_TIGCA|nr:hypothetical protein TCAL_02038 [Tigriopus californicus]|eukprot:TCALIF_02038-PA protein Name:"Similar to nft-1 Nitrilase and fragile histidine triad fusion protein NitFhit (Caenorhabditis elegans)" AED:0.03 eAED:0.03 QI:0/-1/0/1/-1/1/1/0/436
MSSSLVAVLQMTSTNDKGQNFETCRRLIEQAQARGAIMVFLPEAFDFLGLNGTETQALAEPLSGPTISNYQALAAKHKMGLSLGGFHRVHGDKMLNTHVLIDDQGQISGTYAKTHLFDVEIPGQVRLKESDYVIPGDQICDPISTPAGKIGLGICYDLRFPEISLGLARKGADILTFPATFTVPTGMAHWETLLRARAIETQCYVIAAAQIGQHNPKRASYGHSMIIDPWGTVLAHCGQGEGIICAEINLDYLASVRKNMPVAQHRRSDLYGLAMIDDISGTVDQDEVRNFGQVQISGRCVVFETRTAFVAVNKKPVVPGHLLVIPKRHNVPRLCDLTTDEVSDLFLAVQKAEMLAEKHFECNASTVNIQDGEEAGQSIFQLHVHVLPRQAGDFKRNDDIYNELETHDKGDDVKWRSEEEMAKEAEELRRTFWAMK